MDQNRQAGDEWTSSGDIVPFMERTCRIVFNERGVDYRTCPARAYVPTGIKNKQAEK
jgi:hypothetical protein